MQQHSCHHHAKALGEEVTMPKVGFLPVIAHMCTQTHRHTLSLRIHLVSHGRGLHVWIRAFQLHFYPSRCIFCLLLVCTNTALQGNGTFSTPRLCCGVRLWTAWLLSLPRTGNKVGAFGDAEYQYYCPTSDTMPLFTEGWLAQVSVYWVQLLCAHIPQNKWRFL